MEVTLLSDRTPADAPWTVRVLGPLDVSAAGGPVKLGGLKQRLVLAVLAARGGSVVTREALTDALWPTAPPASARHTVEAYVSRLRQALRAVGVDNAIEAGSGGYRLRLDACELDQQRFEVLAARGRRAQEAGDHASAARAFAEALELWRGPAFTGLDDTVALRADAAMLNEYRLQVLEGWAAVQLELGALPDVVRRLRIAVGEHPARERLHELLMTGLFRAGDQVGALDVFREFRSHLAEQFGLEPGQALRDLQRRVLQQESSPAQPAAAAGATRPDGPTVGEAHGAIPLPLRPSTTALVGREPDLARCHASLRACAQASRPQVLLIAGEPGIGKSRLCQEFAQAAEATVLYGRAEREQLLPLQPFAEAIKHHAATCPAEELERQVRAAGGELSRLVTDLPARVPGLDPPLAGDPDGARIRLFSAIERLLRAAARPGPLVVILDDLHWADPLSLMLLKFLVRHLETAPVLFICTYRTTDLAVGHPLARMLLDLRADCTPVHHTLRPLDAAAIAELVADRAGRAVPAHVQRTVFDATDGNPFFAVELLRHMEDDDADAASVPPAVRDLVAQRLDHLDEDVRGILGMAAALGREFELGELRAALQLDDARLTEALDQAAKAHLIHELAGQHERYAFSHALTREAVSSMLSRARRAAQDRAIALALGEEHRNAEELHPLNLARRWSSVSDFLDGPRIAPGPA